MTRENLVTAVGTVTLEQAEKILTAKRVEKLYWLTKIEN